MPLTRGTHVALHCEVSLLPAFWRSRTSSCARLQEWEFFPRDQPCDVACGQPSLLAALHRVTSQQNDSCAQSFCQEPFLFIDSPIPFFSPQTLSYHTNPSRASHSFVIICFSIYKFSTLLGWKVLGVWQRFIINPGWMLLTTRSIYEKHQY